MTKRGKPIQIQHNVVMELVSHLKELPSRDENINKVLTLTQIFHTEAFKREVKALLKRGYTHKEISKIITEKCGIIISERQVKYHYTRAENDGRHKKSTAKVTKKCNEFSADSAPIVPELPSESAEMSLNTTDISLNDGAVSPVEDTEMVNDGAASPVEGTEMVNDGAVSSVEGTEMVNISSIKAATKPGTFEVNMQTDEI